MRLKTLTVAGFRGFAEERTFDLDADAVIIVGANGSGKTSLLDAVLWALTGSIQRLSNKPGDVVSRYSPTGEARVELEVERAGETLRVTRRYDGRDNLTVESAEIGLVSGVAAEATLLDLLWPESKAASDPNQALSRSLTRAIYLQQDEVRQFVDDDDEQARFNVVSELVGVGRVAELQRSLENSRKAWSEATNNLKKDLEPLRSQVGGLEQRANRLSSTSNESTSAEDLARWLDDVSSVLEGAEPAGLPHGSSERIDRVIESLQALHRHQERQILRLQALMEHLSSPRPEVVDASPIEAQIRTTEQLIVDASNELRVAQELAAAHRRRAAEMRDASESLRTMAQLALGHLGDRCPVCAQDYDLEATRIRLTEIVGTTAAPDGEQDIDAVPGAASHLESLQRRLAAEQAELRAARSSEVGAADWDRLARSLAQENGLELAPDLTETTHVKLADLQSRQANVQGLRERGEQLSLDMARESEIAQRADLVSQLETARRELERQEREVDARTKTHELASQLITALRGASNAIVAEELARIGPLLQRIYSSVDPHPSFRAVQFLTQEHRGHGRVWTTLTDHTADTTAREPAVVLSSSQLNVLAVSTFLALNLAIDTLPLQVVALDDPLQSLDTVNLLGLADLLRRVGASRQTIVSTHDDRLAQLLSRKLRPTRGGRTSLIRLEGWGRGGPSVEQHAIAPDETPLRLVATA